VGEASLYLDPVDDLERWLMKIGHDATRSSIECGERTIESGGGAKSTGAAKSMAPEEYCPIMNGK